MPGTGRAPVIDPFALSEPWRQLVQQGQTPAEGRGLAENSRARVFVVFLDATVLPDFGLRFPTIAATLADVAAALWPGIVALDRGDPRTAQAHHRVVGLVAGRDGAANRGENAERLQRCSDAGASRTQSSECAESHDAH